MSRELRVFISYSHTDHEVVSRIRETLDGLAIPYFLDEKDITIGDDVSDRIEGGISACSHLLVVISVGSHESPWVPYEIGFAKGQGLAIIPYLTHVSEKPPPFIHNLKYTSQFDELCSHLQTLGGSHSARWRNPKPFAIRGLFKADPNQSFWGQLLQVATRFNWEICQTGLGLYVNLLDNTYGGVKSVDHAYGVTLVETYRSRGAFTLGPYISGWEGIEVGDEDFMHEYGHYIQSRWLGPFYISVIAWPSFGSAIFASHHERFYTETWANKWALDFFGEKFRDYYNREYGIGSGYRSSINRYGDFGEGWALYGNRRMPQFYNLAIPENRAPGLSIR